MNLRLLLEAPSFLFGEFSLSSPTRLELIKYRNIVTDTVTVTAGLVIDQQSIGVASTVSYPFFAFFKSSFSYTNPRQPVSLRASMVSLGELRSGISQGIDADVVYRFPRLGPVGQLFS
jgi:hypothetical protein